MLDRSIKPEPSGQVNFSLPEIISFNLSNNLKVFYSPKDTLPIVQINLIIPAGSIYDEKEKNGLASLTSMLIDEGSGTLSGLEISDRIEMLGSVLDISTNKEFTTISLLTLKENLHKSMELLSLILLEPSFNDDSFEREKQKLASRIIQLSDDPSFLVSSNFQKIIFEPTPYQYTTSGKLQTLENISNGDVKNFYNNNYSPNGSYLILVGNLDQEEVEGISQKYFGDWKPNYKKENKEVNFKIIEKQISIIDKPGSGQSEIRIGHLSKKRNSRDFYARVILNSILGGQFSSRINLNLREDKGYTYGAHSNYSNNTKCSIFAVSTSVKIENTGDSIKEIIKELTKIKTGISKEELNFSKSYLIRRYPSLFETYSQIASNISLIPIYDLEENYFNNYIRRIDSVNAEDILKAAKENIKIENLVISIVGDKKIIDEQISELPFK